MQSEESFVHHILPCVSAIVASGRNLLPQVGIIHLRGSLSIIFNEEDGNSSSNNGPIQGAIELELG